jgi:hypothetical protein
VPEFFSGGLGPRLSGSQHLPSGVWSGAGQSAAVLPAGSQSANAGKSFVQISSTRSLIRQAKSLFEKCIGGVCWFKRVEALLRLGRRFVQQYAPSPRLASTLLSGAATTKPFFKQALRRSYGQILDFVGCN